MNPGARKPGAMKKHGGDEAGRQNACLVRQSERLEGEPVFSSLLVRTFWWPVTEKMFPLNCSDQQVEQGSCNVEQSVQSVGITSRCCEGSNICC